MNRKTLTSRSVCLLLSIILIFSLIGCASEVDQPQGEVSQSQNEGSQAQAGISFKAGTYTGVARGHNGDIKVEMTVDESKITDIKILEHAESPSISDPAIDRIPGAIIDQQSLAVDSISGATVTSKAIVTAVTEAVKAAGGDIALLSVKQNVSTVDRKTVEYTTDVVVIGGGGAGMAAGVSAHQNGAKVIVLEKMPRVGGNTILAGGALNAVDPGRQSKQGIEDSVDKHFTQTYEGGDKLGNPELIRVLVDNAYPAVEWLESLGMKFNDEVFTVLGGLWPRAHKPSDPLGTGFFNAYSNYINNNDGIEVLLDAEATELIVENGRVVGVKAKGLKEDMILHANNGVVMAAGGFGANVEMRDKYNKHWPQLTSLKTTNHPGATGDGMAMAEKVGANLIGMDQMQLLPMGDPETGSLSGNIEQGVENRIFVNLDGNRFVDEGARRDVMTKALMEQTDSRMWVVLDSHSYPSGDVKNNFNESIDELIAQGRAFKGDTLEELAEKIQVDPQNLVKAVEEFNAAVESKGPDAFGRTLFDQKIDSPPYYAGARVPTVHHTMGGIEITTSAQVVDKDGKIIPGFYAAGEVAGGIHGSNRLGGNALADITVFGKIAGESAALKK